MHIAVKKLKSMNLKAEMEFTLEAGVLEREHHKNLCLLSHLHVQFARESQLEIMTIFMKAKHNFLRMFITN